MQIIVPVASFSSHFTEKQYYFPKPLIEVEGKMMIQQVIENYEKTLDEIEWCFVLDESIEKIEQWLTAVKEHQSTSSTTAGTSENDETSKADLIALPADTHSAQMLALSAENAAIDDCIYFLDRALVRGSIGLDVFLKEVRRLSKRQFLAKVCVLCFNVVLNTSICLSAFLYVYVAWVISAKPILIYISLWYQNTGTLDKDSAMSCS